MKPPVSIDLLMEEWSKDAEVDVTEPGRETANIPKLHAKYLRILTHHNLICKKLMADYTKMKRFKFEYYSGDLNNFEDLERYDIKPFNKKLLRQDIAGYVDSDPDINEILIKKVVHQEIVDFCSSVLKELNNRTFQMGNIIKWELFSSGG